MKKYNKKLIANLKSKQLTLKQLGISMEDIIYLKDIGYNVKEQYDPRVKDYVYYIVSEGDMAYIKISELPAKGEEVKLKLLEISDLHVGCKNFDKKGLDKTLHEVK